jgi:hypothetical protein
MSDKKSRRILYICAEEMCAIIGEDGGGGVIPPMRL